MNIIEKLRKLIDKVDIEESMKEEYFRYHSSPYVNRSSKWIHTKIKDMDEESD